MSLKISPTRIQPSAVDYSVSEEMSAPPSASMSSPASLLKKLGIGAAGLFGMQHILAKLSPQMAKTIARNLDKLKFIPQSLYTPASIRSNGIMDWMKSTTGKTVGIVGGLGVAGLILHQMGLLNKVSNNQDANASSSATPSATPSAFTNLSDKAKLAAGGAITLGTAGTIGGAYVYREPLANAAKYVASKTVNALGSTVGFVGNAAGYVASQAGNATSAVGSTFTAHPVVAGIGTLATLGAGIGVKKALSKPKETEG